MESSFTFPTLGTNEEVSQNPLIAKATVSDSSGANATKAIVSQANDKSSTMRPPKKRPGKVALEKGHSQLDWMRLQRSGKDLAGLKGQRLRRDITMDEVGKHNTVDDAWTVMRGKVYNITPYMRFHPGGVAQLRRGAGIDSTSLFNKYHAWVNADMMLENCLVGLVARSNPGTDDSRPSQAAELSG